MGGKALILSLRSNPLAIFVSHKILLLLTHTARRASRARGSPACQETLIDAGRSGEARVRRAASHGRSVINA